MIASTPTRRSGISFDESIISGNVNSTDTRINDLLRRVESLEMDKCLVSKNRASPACSRLFRRTFKSLEEVGTSYDLTCCFLSPNNRHVTEVVSEETRINALAGENGMRERDIKAVARTFFRSLKDKKKRIDGGKFESHKRRNKRNDRIRRKLDARKAAFERVRDTMSARRQRRTADILQTIYMSSDESDGEEFVTVNLPWESRTVRKIKSKLDRSHLRQKSARSLRMRVIRRRDSERVSDRQPPDDAPQWALIN